MEDENFEEQIDFNEVVDALLDNESTFPPKFLSRLSGLESLDLEQLTETWPQIAPLRRQRLLEDLELLADSSFFVDFDEVFKLGLVDENPHVRKTAIRGLWENDERDTAYKLIDILHNDPDSDVRAQAAGGLGKFIYLGELEEIDPALSNQITQVLIDLFHGDEPEITRRRALESLGFSSRTEVSIQIENAYNSQKEDWIISSLIAMGKSANHQWIPQVTESLFHEESQIRLESATAAGLLGAQETVSHLLQLIDDPEDEVKNAAIWALSEVGGLDARAALEGLLKNSKDEAEIEYYEEALENLDFNDVNIDFDLFDIPENDIGESAGEQDDWEEEM